MYQCISLNHHTYVTTVGRQLRQFFTTFRHGTKPKEFYTKFVTRVFVDDLQSGNFADDFLPLCLNLSSLACWVDCSPLNLPVFESILSPHARPSSTLRRFSFYWESLPSKYQSFHHLLYQNLTHIDIDFGPKVPWEGLASLENLSHFHLDCIVSCSKQKTLQATAIHLDSIVHTVLPHLPPCLRCFILLAPSMVITQFVIHNAEKTGITPQIFSKLISGDYDDRIVLGSSGGLHLVSRTSPPDSLVEESPFRHIVYVPYDLYAWTYLPPGKTDFWMEADDIILNRRQNLMAQSKARDSSMR